MGRSEITTKKGEPVTRPEPTLIWRGQRSNLKGQRLSRGIQLWKFEERRSFLSFGEGLSNGIVPTADKVKA